MKNIFIVILMVFLLSACGRAATPSPMPTETAIPTATATNTPIPMPTLTPTPTIVPLPEFMNEFVQLGYDKQNLGSNSIYVVLDEKATYFASESLGMKYHNSLIFSWSKVYYIVDGVLLTNFILNDFCTNNPAVAHKYFCYVTASDNATNSIHTTKWTTAILNDLHEHSIGDYPIVRLEFNSEHFDAHNDFSNIPNFSFFRDIYPTLTGKFATFELPNIGTFLPATYVEYDFSEGKWLQNP